MKMIENCSKQEISNRIKLGNWKRISFSPTTGVQIEENQNLSLRGSPLSFSSLELEGYMEDALRYLKISEENSDDSSSNPILSPDLDEPI